MGSNPTLSVLYVERLGEVLEWPNRRDWKSRVPFIEEPWVRIPPSPPYFYIYKEVKTDECLKIW